MKLFAKLYHQENLKIIKEFILKTEKLTSDELLKLSFFAALYESIDLTYFCLRQHDKSFSNHVISC